MTYKNIYDFFKNDCSLLDYIDPFSKATNNEEAALEIYQKLVDHSNERHCKFYRTEIGYIFYAKGLLISFCIKPEFRNKETLKFFGNLIKEKVGDHFNCFLFNRNTRAINFLEKLGMKKVKSNDSITLLSL
jgi:hypothetical protein